MKAVDPCFSSSSKSYALNSNNNSDFGTEQNSSSFVPEDPSTEFKDYLKLMLRKQTEIRNDARAHLGALPLKYALDESAVAAVAIVVEELVHADLVKRKEEIVSVGK